MKRIAQSLATLAAVGLLAACSSPGGLSSYEAGLKANVDQYRLQTDVQLAQQQTLQACYKYNPNKSECAINTAATNAQQTLAGQPQPLRIAKSTGEILEAIADKGLEAAKVIYGIDAVQKAIVANANALRDTATAGAAAQTQIAQDGITAASKPPLVVDQPVVVQVPAGSSVLPTTPVVAE